METQQNKLDIFITRGIRKIWFSKFHKYWFPILCCLFFVGCDFPRDPAQTFDNASKNGLRVGIASNPPFTNVSEGSISGKEVELIEKFGQKHNIKLSYVAASESVLIELLKTDELQVIIGGFTQKTVWAKHAGLTVPYDASGHVFLIPKGENRLTFELEKHFNESTVK